MVPSLLPPWGSILREIHRFMAPCLRFITLHQVFLLRRLQMWTNSLIRSVRIRFLIAKKPVFHRNHPSMSRKINILNDSRFLLLIYIFLYRDCDSSSDNLVPPIPPKKNAKQRHSSVSDIECQRLSSEVSPASSHESFSRHESCARDTSTPIRSIDLTSQLGNSFLRAYDHSFSSLDSSFNSVSM